MFVYMTSNGSIINGKPLDNFNVVFKSSIIVRDDNTVEPYDIDSKIKHSNSFTHSNSDTNNDNVNVKQYINQIDALKNELENANHIISAFKSNPSNAETLSSPMNSTCPKCFCKNVKLPAPESTYSALKYTINYYNKARGYFCPSGCLSLDEQPKKGKGVYFQAYGADAYTANTYFQEVYDAAKMIKQMSPSIQIAVATNHILTDEEKQYFDHVIRINDIHLFAGGSDGNYKGMRRQFITRVMYYAATPFQTTVTFDATVRFCDKQALSELLQTFSESGVDFSISNRNNGKFFPSTWFILFNWNARTKLLLRDWLYELISGTYYLDEQYPLLRSLIKATTDDRIVFKRLSNNWAFTPRCYDKKGQGDKGCASMVGIPVTGRIRAIHGYDNTYCDVLNNEAELDQSPRSYCLNAFKHKDLIQNNVFINGTGHTVVHNQQELEKCLSGLVAPQFNWDIKKRPSEGLFWEDCSADQFYRNNKNWCGMN